MVDIIVVRALFLLILGGIAYFSRPFSMPSPIAFFSALLIGLLALAVEIRLKQTAVTRILGAAGGLVFGTLTALLISTIVAEAKLSSATTQFVQLTTLALGAYLGATIGASKGELFHRITGAGPFGGEKPVSSCPALILDTSVIIDGRIADIADTGFLNDSIAIPQFVLRELQMVADSADSLKRNRGRRGLDILQRIQKIPHLNVQILEHDFPHVRDVDMKLVELGKLLNGKVVTNDFNLNKVAQLHGVEVLNINELANAVKPVVLPGEIMRVFVLKEGKEYNQGVAYLDDGTMVVVDNARRQISKTIDISVTTVLQTTAGKMIFAKFDEKLHTVYEKSSSAVPERADRPHRDASAAAPQG